jgi:hypothetical protein
MVDGYGRIPARIGSVEFTYGDPSVSVDTEQETVEHETIDEQIIIQTIGEKADSITIEGVVPDWELPIIDNLVGLDVVELRTQRWTGDVIVQSTATSFNRARNIHGSWLYDATIECLEVDEYSLTPDIPPGQGENLPFNPELALEIAEDTDLDNT